MPLDDQSELFYWVDRDDNVLGSITRKQAHSEPFKIHRAVQIVLFDPDRTSTLLQQRSMKKDTNPGIWTVSASGHVTYGDTYEQAVRRELGEELGIDVDPEFVTKNLITDDDESEFDALFIGVYSGTPDKFDRYEVDQVAWVILKQLKTFIAQNPITPNARAAFQSLKLI